MNQNLESQNLNYLNNSLVIEGSEEGLKLDEIKNAIFRKFPLIAGCTIVLTSIALIKVLITPPEYVAGFELLSEPVNIETKVTSRDNNTRQTREEIATVQLDEVQLKILKSPRFISRVIESLKDKHPEITYGELIGGLTIEIISTKREGHNILNVVYQNPDKEKVSDVIDALTESYLKYSVEKRQSGVKRAIAFLDRQIPKVEAEAKDISDQIRLLRNQYSFVNPQASLTQITSRLAEVDRRREGNEGELRELRLKSERLKRQLKTQPTKSTTAISLATPKYNAILKQLQDINIEISRKSSFLTDNSEILQALKQEKQELELLLVDAGADIRQKLDGQIATRERRQKSIIAETNNLQSRLEQWSAISGEYNDLQQRLNVARAKLNGFNSQKDALQIDTAQQESPWQLLTPASEPATNSVSTVNYLVLSSTLGLILGVGIALMLDKHQNIIYTSAKVEEITSLPILSTIPHSPKSKQASFLPSMSFYRQERSLAPNIAQSQGREILPVKYSNASIEAFRSFASNLGLLNFNTNSATADIDPALKSIVITSAIPREGKSTVALNLARASASMEKQVLLVDTDLRSVDSLSTDLGLETEIGLKNILNQNNPEQLLGCIKQVPMEDNLFILTSGVDDVEYDSASPAQDHSRLLASAKMNRLMETLKVNFDLVIYDLCSIIGFADVNLIATKTDDCPS